MWFFKNVSWMCLLPASLNIFDPEVLQAAEDGTAKACDLFFALSTNVFKPLGGRVVQSGCRCRNLGSAGLPCRSSKLKRDQRLLHAVEFFYVGKFECQGSGARNSVQFVFCSIFHQTLTPIELVRRDQ